MKISFQKTIYILWPFVIYYGACRMAQIFILQFLEFGGQRFGEDYRSFISDHGAAVQGGIMGLYMLVGLLAISRMVKPEFHFSPREWWESLKGQKAGYIGLCLLAVTSALGVNGLLSLTGLAGRSAAYTEVAERQFSVPLGVGMAVFGVIAPLAEEVLFRGIIYNRMKKFFPVLLSMLVSSLLFGAYHGNLVQGIYGGIMGLLIVWVYERYRSFAAPLLFHAVANISVFGLTYLTEIHKMLTGPVMCAVFLPTAAGIFIYLWHKDTKNF